MAGENFGAGFSIDITNLKAGLAEANRLIRESESEFREAAAGMDDWSESEEGLTKRTQSLSKQIELQESKVDALVRAKQDIIDKMTAEGKSQEEIARATDATNKQIINEAKQLDRLKGELGKAEKGLDDLGKETEDTGKSFEGLKAAGSAAVGAITAVAAAGAAAVTAFFGLAESTRESREAMGKLETAFESAGLTAEQASGTFSELYGILGDEGKAAESASFLAKYADDEKALAEQTRILTGVFAEYGESIPTEGLAEGIAASSAMGSVQGVLADALEWQGVNLDNFNESLAACANEQERSALITETLTDLYGESADAYKKNNADIIAANKAQAALTDTMNQLGAVAEPIMTTLKQLTADLLQSMLPFVQLVGEGLQGAFNGTEGAAGKLAEGLGGIIDSLVGVVEEALPLVIEALTELLPSVITTIIDVLVDSIPMLLDAAIQLLNALVQAIPPIIEELLVKLPDIVDTIVDFLVEAFPILVEAAVKMLLAIVSAIPEILKALVKNLPRIISTITKTLLDNAPLLFKASVDLFFSLLDAIPEIAKELAKEVPTLITTICDELSEGVSDVFEIGKDLVRGLWNGINDMVDWIGDKISGFGDRILDDLKDFFGIASPSKVMADIVGKNLALGIGEGFTSSISAVARDMQHSLDGFAPNLAIDATAGAAGAAGGRAVTVYQTNNYSQEHSRYELYKSQQQTAQAVRLALRTV